MYEEDNLLLGRQLIAIRRSFGAMGYPIYIKTCMKIQEYDGDRLYVLEEI